MKRELNAALVECADEVMPTSWGDFTCRKKARSGLVFWSAKYAAQSLWLFLKVEPDAKVEGIKVHFGWTTEEEIPAHVPWDLRSADLRGREIELPMHERCLKHFYQSLGDAYEVLPLPLTIEEAIEYMKPLAPECAKSLIRATLVVIRADLENYVPSYLEWLVDKRRTMV